MHIPDNASKSDAFAVVAAYLEQLSITITETDDDRPWGGFYVIGEDSLSSFIATFFPEIDTTQIYKYGARLRPKILIVLPGKKLSWQYHHRRAELWKVILGPVGVLVSNNNTQPKTPDVLQSGEVVEHADLVRHRLIGLESWGVVAEIWQHTDPGNLSEESDIVRVEDSYGRN